MNTDVPAAAAARRMLDGGPLDEARARELFRLGEEAVVFALLALSRGAGSRESQAAPSTPSAMIPVYEKPAGKQRRKRPGARPGHAGHHRPVPSRIDQRREHQAPCCPDCGGGLKRTGQARTRYTEDIPQDLTPVATEHTIHRDWCPHCRKRVEPRVPDALPGATLGNRTLVLTAWLHYGLGNTLSQIVEIFRHHLQLPLTPGGLVQMWHRLADFLQPWYEELQHQALNSAVLHADETGWRVNGKTHWLWCFGNPEVTYYLISPSRGSPALDEFFVTEFGGTLVTDFWAAYDSVACGDRQRCWPHLLRELKKVEARGSAHGDWPTFARRVQRLFHDALRLRAARNEMAQEQCDLAIVRLENRAADLACHPWRHDDARRLAGRLAKYGPELFTFLWHESVPSDNNHAERAIRPAVVMRKNSYHNGSDRGAQTQALLMSIYRSLKQRGHDPLTTITSALAQALTTGKLPPLPPSAVADG